jgi:anti-sigma B factor antagonist
MVQITTRQFADTLVAAPRGRIDHLSAGAFENALTPLLAQAGAGGGALVLDFSGVEYISSVGLRVLMIGAEKMRAQQARLVVAALQTVVAEIFAISRFHRILVVCPTLEDALEQSSAAALAAYRELGPGATP